MLNSKYILNSVFYINKYLHRLLIIIMSDSEKKQLILKTRSLVYVPRQVDLSAGKTLLIFSYAAYIFNVPSNLN